MKKNNKPYKRLAIEYSGKVFEEFQESIDVWELVQDYLIEMAEGEEDSPSGGDPMDVDDMKDKPLNLVIQANSFKALSYCWPASLVGVQGECG